MSNRQTQLTLDLKDKKTPVTHGGEGYKNLGKRKPERPFDPGKPLHITMKSSLAKGGLSMLHPVRAKVIQDIVFRAAKRHYIVVRRFVSVGNHLHILIQTKSRRTFMAREALRAFMREVSGLIARVMTGARKGAPVGIKTWDHIAYSRIVEWGKDLLGIHKYFTKNERDAIMVLARHNWPLPPHPPPELV